LYNNAELPVFADGNIYCNGVEVFTADKNFLEIKAQLEVKIQDDKSGFFIDFNFPESIKKLKTKSITTELLGKVIVPEQGFENRDGTSLSVDYDFFGNKRSKKNPTAGPFENPNESEIELRLWN
jgi:hypothetical protein